MVKRLPIPESVVFKLPPSRWGFLISIVLGTICILFFGTIYAMTGMIFNIQPLVQVTC